MDSYPPWASWVPWGTAHSAHSAGAHGDMVRTAHSAGRRPPLPPLAPRSHARHNTDHAVFPAGSTGSSGRVSTGALIHRPFAIGRPQRHPEETERRGWTSIRLDEYTGLAARRGWRRRRGVAPTPPPPPPPPQRRCAKQYPSCSQSGAAGAAHALTVPARGSAATGHGHTLCDIVQYCRRASLRIKVLAIIKY